MRFNQYETLINAEKDLRSKGFDRQFILEKDTMRCAGTNKHYLPKEMRILEYHRFEGASNPADSSIIFAIICQDGEKGTIISNYSAKVNIELISFIEKIRVIGKDNLQEAFTS